MATTRKVEQVSDLTDRLRRTQLTLVADYRGLTVAEISELRRRLREAGAELVVAKNTLTLIAARETGHEAIEPLLAGPTALAFAFGDPAKTAKAVGDFNRGPKKLVVRGALLGTSRLDGDVIDQATKMPSRQQVLAEVVGGSSAPVSGVVGVISAAISNVVYTVQARIDQLQPAE